MTKRLATILRTLADRLDPPPVKSFPATQFAGNGLVLNVYGQDLERE